MASEYEPKTDVYAKKLPEELCTLFMKDIAEGDAELFSLAGVGKDFIQEGDQVKVSADDTLDDLQRKGHVLLMLQLRIDLNLMHMKCLVRHAERMKRMLTASYI